MTLFKVTNVPYNPTLVSGVGVFIPEDDGSELYQVAYLDGGHCFCTDYSPDEWSQSRDGAIDLAVRNYREKASENIRRLEGMRNG